MKYILLHFFFDNICLILTTSILTISYRKTYQFGMFLRAPSFPLDSGLYRSHSAGDYEHERGGISINDRWHSTSSGGGGGDGGGNYRDGFDKERERVRRETDERERGNRDLQSMDRRPATISNYFDQPRGTSRERERERERDKLREYPNIRDSGSRDIGREPGREPTRELIRDLGREPGRIQRSLSPKYVESTPRRRSTISGDGYSLGIPPVGYWTRMGGMESASSSSNRQRSLSPGERDYHLEERDILRGGGGGGGGGEGIMRSSSRIEGGSGSGSGARSSSGSGSGSGSSYGEDPRIAFDGYRRTGVSREDSTGVGTGTRAGFGFLSSGAGYSRERYSSFGDLNSERGGEARSGEIRNGEVRAVGRGIWGSSNGIPKGTFFSGRGGINRFGSSFESSVRGGGGGGLSGFNGTRSFPLQRRGMDEGKRQYQHQQQQQQQQQQHQQQQHSDDKERDKEKERSFSNGLIRERESRTTSATNTTSNGNEGSSAQCNNSGNDHPSGEIGSPCGVVGDAMGDTMDEENDNMDIDTDTVEVMATPVRKKRVITGTMQCCAIYCNE